MEDKVKKKICLSNRNYFLWISLLFLIVSCRGISESEGQSPSEASTANKITLVSEMVINEVAKGNARKLIDEQEKQTGAPVTSWSVEVPEGKLEWFLPANAVIDLGREYVITDVHLYDGDGEAGNVHINYGIPFRWTKLLTDPMEDMNVWTEHKAGNIRTRFIQISKETNSDLREVILYGYPVGPDPENDRTTAKVPPVAHNKIGVNSYIDDPMDKVRVAGIVREYHHWHYNEGGYMKGYPGYPNNQLQFNPASAGGPNFSSIRGYPNDLREWSPNYMEGLNFDAYYKRMKEANILVWPVIQGTPPWFDPTTDSSTRKKPVREGADPTDPASYMAHADFMFQYAARYGSMKVADSKLKLAPNQDRRSGLNYLEYYENWNEPDGWWGGRSNYFSPYEYAAMSSADYDGHESTMGKDKGIKNADPNAKLVMSGVAIPNPDYMRAMKFWFEHNRKDRKFVFDVLTVHHYSNEGGGQAVMRTGISPEEDGLREVMREVVEFRNKHAPGKEVWMTEFGWDTNPVTPQAAPNEEVQGKWLVRAFLECLAAGMNRVAMYMIPDTNPDSETQFSSSGLIGPRGNHEPKPSWYYVYTLRTQLAGKIFNGEVHTAGGGVKIYKFKDPGSKKGVYVLWSPTTDGTVVPDFELQLGETFSTPELVTMKVGEQNGVSKEMIVKNGSVKVNVSELPIFVQVDRMD